jgi:hypothetical protein
MQSGFTGRLTAEQIAVIMGFKPHDIPILIRAGLLKPLGKPTTTCTKFFAAVHIYTKAADPVWLAKATNAIYKHWKQ